MIDKARSFAVAAHGNQLYGDLPYHTHLDAVVGLLEPYGEQAQVIGYLHDVVEDTGVTITQVERLYGKLVADAVEILSDEEGENRALRKIKTYQKMARVKEELQIALVVKVADRLANVQACHEMHRLDKLAMYQKEHEVFRQSLYRPGLCEPLWEELEQAIQS
ncbi:(p)ppGpp synthase/HD superfamily hydrolase [Litorivivens lipolytica]|uniref:(P)ppGpp synthase/HD superfamily hydrolase n=1 Tax=Litorivivens lipolytica TaxID=1524264 RepID=A0A7W4W805_9GAMM|nr:HD domain-containing protein [Litorivivens lipolytica]MBB3048975.1 (p)ppGpp synthase/HD superfamily hydrolase [Litorivivens lipolytica]